MTLTPATKKKLLEIAKSLDTQPKARFNMETYGESSCGTVFCAIGWFVFNKLKQPSRLGFKFTDQCSDLMIYFRNAIGSKRTDALFAADSRIESPKALARVIRRFVRTGVLEFKRNEVRE